MPSGRRERAGGGGGGSARRRRSATSSSVAVAETTAPPALTGDLTHDLPLAAVQQGVDFMPPVRVVLVPPFPAEPTGDTATDPAETSAQPPPPPQNAYQKRLQEISQRYDFYQPQVRLQVRAAAARRDAETGALSGPVHGVQVSGWRCEAAHLAAMHACFAAVETLTTLTLNNAALDGAALSALAALLAERPHISALNVDSNPGIGAALPALLAPPAGVQALSARSCGVGDADVRALLPVLTCMTSRAALRFNTAPLRLLNLTNNCIGGEGAMTLARVLRSNRQLSMLTLTHNRIDTAGAAALAEVLRPFALTQEEVVDGRRAHSSVRPLVELKCEEALKHRLPTCTGKCCQGGAGPHVHKGGCSEERGGGGGSSSGRRTPSRLARSPSKRVREPEPPPEPPAVETLVRDMMATVIHPLTTLAQCQDGRLVNPGNLVLSNLSLAYNRAVGAAAADAFVETLAYQQAVSAADARTLGPGLLHLKLTGTGAAANSQLAELLRQRQPVAAEPPPPPERAARIGRTNTQASLVSVVESRRVAGRSTGRQRRYRN